ncbi:MAG: tetratricopeptide repeat protein, partial [Candidatus Omnitrophica bacterium]|nr:tetratricopeptide repeat protein [Candidatus Omnitrophota bacterium]
FGGVSLDSYPYKAVDFLVDHKVKGNFFNDFNSGAYLLGRTFPDIKVSMDGRTEVYGGEYFRGYLKIWEKGDTQLFEKIVQEYQLTGVFLSSVRQLIPAKFLNYLYDSPDWKLVYFDYDAVIFLKNIKEYQDLIMEHDIDLLKWESEPLDIVKIGPKRLEPYRYYYRAFTLESMGFDDQAKKEAKMALDFNPSYAKPYELIGRIYAKHEMYEKAFKYFRVATMFQPGNIKMRYNLASAYFDIGEHEKALEEYDRIIQMKPNEPKALFLKSRVLIKLEKYEAAYQAIEKGNALNPRNVEDLMTLGDQLAEEGEFLYARRFYELGFSSDRHQDLLSEKVGDLYLLMNQAQDAVHYFEKALQINPELNRIQVKMGPLNHLNPMK